MKSPHSLFTLEKMASLEDIIASKDIEAIKRKRGSIMAMITVVRKSIIRILVRTEAGEFDHPAISKLTKLSMLG